MLFAAINWHSLFFLFFAAFACAFAIGVAVSSNVVRMAFYLTISLGATAGLFMLAGAHFVGAMQLMIYVGDTLVLLIFGMMLTAQAGTLSMKTLGGDWIKAIVVGGVLLFVLLTNAFQVTEWGSQNWSRSSVVVEDATTRIGLGFITDYRLPFEIVSVHLLVVLVGAAFLARAKRKAAGGSPDSLET